MKTELRTITNGNGKTINLRIAPSDTTQHIWHTVEWTITASQWRRIVRESDDTAWSTERGATVAWTCYPYAAGCKYPGRK